VKFIYVVYVSSTSKDTLSATANLKLNKILRN